MLPSPILTALKEIGQFLGKKLDQVSNNISRLNIDAAVGAQTRTLETAVARIERAIDKIKDPIFSGEVTIDTSAMERELRAALSALKALKIPDIQTVEALLKSILVELQKDDDGTEYQALTNAIGAVEAAVKNLALPTTFKIDQNQMRALTGSFSSMPTYPGPMSARNVVTANVALTSSSTEYSYTFPANTQKWSLKLRDQGTLAYYAFVSGKMPAGGDSSNYVTISQNYVHSPDGVDWSGKVIYLGAESASQVAELTVYTA